MTAYSTSEIKMIIDKVQGLSSLLTFATLLVHGSLVALTLLLGWIILDDCFSQRLSDLFATSIFIEHIVLAKFVVQSNETKVGGHDLVIHVRYNDTLSNLGLSVGVCINVGINECSKASIGQMTVSCLSSGTENVVSSIVVVVVVVVAVVVLLVVRS